MREILPSPLSGKGAGAAPLGSSPAFLESIARLPRIAGSGAAVLVEGETGTGKEMIARALHYLGPRVGFPFVPVNCGALPDALLEDELFGHERGAFTDAHLRRQGLVALADKGTLFLDEIDSLSRKAQVSLLRVLQEGRFRPVGSGPEQSADIRVVAATHAPLEQLVGTGAFRTDLYYRLCVFRIHLPPLRRRQEDVVLLAEHFLDKHAHENRPAALSPPAVAALLAYDWPGNVRELENTMIRASLLCRDGRIEPDDLGLPTAAPATDGAIGQFQEMKQATIRNFEQDYLRRLLAAHRGNVTQAARTSGQDRRELGKLLKKHRIDPCSYLSSGLGG